MLRVRAPLVREQTIASKQPSTLVPSLEHYDCMPPYTLNATSGVAQNKLRPIQLVNFHDVALSSLKSTQATSHDFRVQVRNMSPLHTIKKASTIKGPQNPRPYFHLRQGGHAWGFGALYFTGSGGGWAWSLVGSSGGVGAFGDDEAYRLWQGCGGLFRRRAARTIPKVWGLRCIWLGRRGLQYTPFHEPRTSSHAIISNIRCRNPNRWSRHKLFGAGCVRV